MTTETGASRDTRLRADCTIDPDGRISFALRPPAAVDFRSSRMLLRLRPKKGQPEKVVHVLDLEPADDGSLRAVLEPQPQLAEGRWDVYVLAEPRESGDAGDSTDSGESIESIESIESGDPGESGDTGGLGDPGARRQRIRPGLRDLRVLVDGQSRDRPSPVAVRVPYATKDGYLAVRAWLRTAHAEVEGVEVTDRSMTVRARLHGATLADGATVRLRLRGGDGVVRTLEPRAASDGRAFSFTVDYGELAAGHGTGSRVWDLSVQPRPAAGAPPVRIGRLLDDVADRKEIFVYPQAAVGGVTVRPYYTVDNDLSVEVTAVRP
ncbi:transferase [Streptomyces sp. ISL-22]|uniref:transferase n=1 Tax=unclassified Streptomyces TaxID=2593676 RepID=UPI001BECAB85|nr:MULTISPECIES: transferase [unclassified Streptomyces]MBT2421140.1 transferase [Streptomyces sp. ISL-24]MBT2432783.1 transferase [Streptomyces sp. ISL-22]